MLAFITKNEESSLFDMASTRGKFKNLYRKEYLLPILWKKTMHSTYIFSLRNNTYQLEK